MASQISWNISRFCARFIKFFIVVKYCLRFKCYSKSNRRIFGPIIMKLSDIFCCFFCRKKRPPQDKSLAKSNVPLLVEVDNPNVLTDPDKQMLHENDLLLEQDRRLRIKGNNTTFALDHINMILSHDPANQAALEQKEIIIEEYKNAAGVALCRLALLIQ